MNDTVEGHVKLAEININRFKGVQQLDSERRYIEQALLHLTIAKEKLDKIAGEIKVVK